MFRVKTFRSYYLQEDTLAREVENYLINTVVDRSNIIDIKYTANDNWLYCMIIWED